MYKYNQSEFESMMDELIHDFKKSCGKSDAELDVAYKILNPSPVGGFVDSLVKMDKDYSTNLWEIKRKQIKSFIPECDGYQLDDIVASMRDNVHESITLKLGDGCTVDEIAREYNANKSFHDNLKENEVQILLQKNIIMMETSI